jgi:hypothetical protein
MGWKNIRTIPVYVRPISLFSIAKKYIRNPFLRMFATPFLLISQIILSLIDMRPSRSINVDEVFGFENSLIDFLKSWSNQKVIYASRDIKHLNWRFLDFKARGYVIFTASKNGFITGFVVLRLMPMKGYRTVAIVDLVVGDEDTNTRSALLNSAIKFAKSSGVDLIATLGNPVP